jgi:hypothetical protein
MYAKLLQACYTIEVLLNAVAESLAQDAFCYKLANTSNRSAAHATKRTCVNTHTPVHTQCALYITLMA